MYMSELKQRLYKLELAKIGFPDAGYDTSAEKMRIQPDNDRMPIISNNGDIHYGTEYDQLVRNIIRPAVDKVNEIVAVWEHSRPAPIESVSNFNILTEYNNIVLAAHDDSEYKRGLHFVVWQYDTDRAGFSRGYYTEDFIAAKENFALRAGLIQKEKVITVRVAADISAAIEDYILNSADEHLDSESEERLNSFNDGIYNAYPKIFERRIPTKHEYQHKHEKAVNKKPDKESIKKPAKKPTLQAKLDTAKQKAAQVEAQNPERGTKTKNRAGSEMDV